VYDALVALHVVSAVIGFGALGVTGVYGGMAGRAGRPEGDDETRRYFAGALRAEWTLLVVPFLGVAALVTGPKRHDAGDLWVIASALLWLVAAGVLVHVVRPAERRVRAIAAGTDAGDLRPAARTVLRASLVTDIVFVVALALMVTQPS
jgi:uncharacterized membrane protein